MAAITVLFFRRLSKKIIMNSFFAVILGLLIAFYAHTTWLRNYDWRSDLTLWKKTVKTFPGSVRAHYNLGVAYSGLGLKKEAEREFVFAENLTRFYARKYKTIKGRSVNETNE
jgi:hypothetical protein